MQPVLVGCSVCVPQKSLSLNSSNRHLRPLQFVDFKPGTTGILTVILRLKRIINSAGSQKRNTYLVKKQVIFLKLSMFILGDSRLPTTCFYIQLESHTKGFLANIKYGHYTCFLHEICSCLGVMSRFG